MTKTKTPLFFQAIEHLRQNEEVMLYGYLLDIDVQDARQTSDFLEFEYAKESMAYPFVVPNFDAKAALWAAKTLYLGAQLLLYRENRVEDIPPLFPDYTGEITAGAILSADLCLRFVPDLVRHLKVIDPTDGLIYILEQQLYTWHYSAVNYPLEEIEKLDFKPVSANPCLHLLYINRIIEHKKLSLAQLPAFASDIRAHLGIYTDDFWKELLAVSR